MRKFTVAALAALALMLTTAPLAAAATYVLGPFTVKKKGVTYTVVCTITITDLNGNGVIEEGEATGSCTYTPVP